MRKESLVLKKKKKIKYGSFQSLAVLSFHHIHEFFFTEIK